MKPLLWREASGHWVESTFFLLWAGAAVCLTEIWVGVLLVPLGFAVGLLVIIVGHLIGNTTFALGGIIGSRVGVPTMVGVRPSFGVRGSYFAAVVNIIQLIGWTGVMLWIGGKAAQSIWPFPGLGMHGWILVAGIFTTLWSFIGQKYWKWLQRIAVTALLILCCVMSYIVFAEYGWSRLMAVPAKGGLPFMIGLDLVIAMPISWLPLVSDYSRFSKNTASAFSGTWIGYFILSCWMYTIGLGAALATGSDTPDAIVLELMVGFGLALPALIIVLVSTFTTTFLDIYSTSVSALNIWPNMGASKGVVACGVLGTVLALVFPATAYEHFLLMIGSVFCPLFGVVLADYFIVRKSRYDTGQLNGRGAYWYTGGFNPIAFAAWIVGFALFHYLQQTTSIGSSIPSLLVTGILYIALMGMRKSES